MQLPSIEEIINEIDRLNREKVDNKKQITGFTTQELAEYTGKSAAWCRETIRYMIKKGLVIFVGKTEDLAIDGKKCLIPVYRLIRQEKKD